MTTPLIPRKQITVSFHDVQITAVLTEDDLVCIPLRPICKLIGLAWSPQRRRINRDPVLSEELRCVEVINRSRGRQEMLCLPKEYVQYWIDGVNPLRAKPLVRKNLVRYQSRGEFKKRIAFVYVVKATESSGMAYYKIGRTCNRMDAYLRSLQSRCPLPLEIASVHKCDEVTSYRLEKHLHDMFASKRIHGEWFSLGKNDVNKIGEAASMYFNNR